MALAETKEAERKKKKKEKKLKIKKGNDLKQTSHVRRKLKINICIQIRGSYPILSR